MVRTSCFHCQEPRFNPWSGNSTGHKAKKKKGKKKENKSAMIIVFIFNLIICFFRISSKLIIYG